MKIAVLGVGTVGVVSVCHWLRYTKNIEIYSISDPSIKILGIGESTNINFAGDLFLASGFNMMEHNKEMDATFKLGVKWTNWRNNDFFTYIEPPVYGIHFNNFKIKSTIFNRIKKKSPERLKEIEGHIKYIKNNKDNVIVNVDNVDYEFDYVIDCTGYPKDYSEYNVLNTIPVNRGLVNMINEPGDWNFTHHRATKNGWMFGIPLQTRQGWGYLFNDKITSIEEAKEDIKNIFGEKTNEKLNDFKWTSFYAKKFLDGRILKNGNKALFFEPIEAIAGVFYDNINRALYDRINGVPEDEINKRLTTWAKSYENFICFLYSGGSNFKSKFWDITINKTNKHLTNNTLWKESKGIIDEFIHTRVDHDNDLKCFPFSPHVWEYFLKEFNRSE